MKAYQSILINLLNHSDNQSKQIIKQYYKKHDRLLKDDGTLWILCNTSIKNNEPVVHPFAIAEEFKRYYLKNIIIVPGFNRINEGTFFDNCVYHILFFSKNEQYFFDKDPIREKHIWKDVEWGKRKKNYNPKGKFPGNVWLKTKDDGKGKITEHVAISFKDVIKRIIQCSTKGKSNCLLINFNKAQVNMPAININYE